MDSELYKKIIEGNIEVHEKEASFYDCIHSEIYNFIEQKRIKNGLLFIHKRIRKNSFKALDIGCGTGNITLKLAELGYSVTSVDISEPMLNILKEKVSLHKYKHRISLVKSNVDDFINNQSQSYDIVTFSSVLHHLPDYLTTLKKTCNIVKNQGFVFIIHEPRGKCLEIKHSWFRERFCSLENRIYSRVARMPKDIPKRDWSYSDYHVYHGFSEDKVKELVTINKFNILKFRYYSALMHFGISNLIDTYFFRTKSNFMMIAQKLK